MTSSKWKNDVSLRKLGINVKNLTAVAVRVDFYLLASKLFKGKLLPCSKFYFDIKCGKSKGMEEKVSIMGVWC